MTQQEWMECRQPSKMLALLNDRASKRKKQLVSLACCCRLVNSLTDDRLRTALNVVERFIDGTVRRGEVKSWYKRIAQARSTGNPEKRIKSPESGIASLLSLLRDCFQPNPAFTAWTSEQAMMEVKSRSRLTAWREWALGTEEESDTSTFSEPSSTTPSAPCPPSPLLSSPGTTAPFPNWPRRFTMNADSRICRFLGMP